jgi:hypothetical protein
MRYAPEPADVFLTIDPESGGVAAAESPDPKPKTRSAPVREAVKAAILAALPASKSDVATRIGRKLNDSTFRGAWGELEAAGEIAQNGSGWVVVVMSDPRATDDDDYHENGSVEPNRNGNGWRPHLPDEGAPDWWAER